MSKILKKTKAIVEQLKEDTNKELNKEKDSKKEYRKLKSKLEATQKARVMKMPMIFGTIMSITLFFLLARIDTDLIQEQEDFLFDLLGSTEAVMCVEILGVVGVAACMPYVMNIVFMERENEIRRKMLDYEVEDIKDEVQEDIFENSIKMSYKYLDQYYYQTRNQAEKGFLITACIAVLGAILIGIGVVMMFSNQIEPSYLTCASGVMTELIAAVFFYLYNKTITSMSKYHNKLVLSHNISIALKVADSLPADDKVDEKKLIISELLKNINSYLIKNDSDSK